MASVDIGERIGMRHVRIVLYAWLLVGGTAAAQQPALSPGENLVIKGIPPVPASILTAIAAYSEFRQAAFLSWIGPAREMLICTRFGSAYQIHRVSKPGGARSQLTFVPAGIAITQPSDAVAAASPDGRSFVYVRDVGGGRERYQLFQYRFATADTRMIADGDSPVWSPDGRRLAFTSIRRTGVDRDVYLVDPEQPDSARLLAPVNGNWRLLDWSPDGRALLALESVSSAESRLWMVDVQSGATRELRVSTGPSLTAGAQFRSPASIIASNDAGGEFLRLIEVDITNGHITPLAETRGDVDALSLSPDRSRVAFVANEDGVGVLHVYDLKLRRTVPLKALPDGSVLSVRWHPSGAEIAFDVNSSRHPRDVFSLDLVSGRVARWTTGETNGLDAASLPEAQLVRWKGFDGLPISGFLYRPPRKFTGKRPVIVNIHGGPADRERPRFLGFSNYFLNELGIALIYPNVRGSTGFGKSFVKADDGLNREGPVKDIGALLDWIEAQPDLDASRVMLTGASFGGYMTYAAAAAYPGRIRCAFAGSAISNLVTDLEHTAPDRLVDRRAEYGDERDPHMREFLSRIAPLHQAPRLRMPLFIAHGKNDQRVPVGEAERMAAAVESNGAPLWYLLANDEGHGFGRKPNVDFLFSAWALFVQTYLVGPDGTSTGSQRLVQ
jgi:dipeptidyl aminopeptidase/acylaminoacyl peptidase